MELSDQQNIKASREQVFAALNDPEILRQCIPGCEGLDKISDTEMTAKVTLKVGPVKAKFSGAVTLSNLNPPDSYTITGEGKGGAAGFAKGGADIELHTESDGSTTLKYNVKVNVGGKIAQLGSRLMESTTRKLASQFFEKFATLVETDEAEEVVAVAADDNSDKIPAGTTESDTPEQSSNQKLYLVLGICVAAAVGWYLFGS